MWYNFFRHTFKGGIIMAKMIVIIQCDTTMKRCSGANCAYAFYTKSGMFTDLPDETMYLAMTCGGCCGGLLAAKLENLSNRISNLGLTKDDITIHLASCIVSENHHRQPCPFKGYIKKLAEHHGFKVVPGTYISKKAQKKRESGEYRGWV